jgi:hypothetical protein
MPEKTNHPLCARGDTKDTHPPATTFPAETSVILFDLPELTPNQAPSSVLGIAYVPFCSIPTTSLHATGA